MVGDGWRGSKKRRKGNISCNSVNSKNKIINVANRIEELNFKVYLITRGLVQESCTGGVPLTGLCPLAIWGPSWDVRDPVLA